MNENIRALLAVGRQRALKIDAAYAGALTPQEAFLLLKAQPMAKLIDVRTIAERDWVGRVVIPDAQHASVQWSLYPGGTENQDFLSQLQVAAESVEKSDSDISRGKDCILLFLCRSGVRSRSAAKKATEHGYLHCFDILDGFEGDKNAAGHRKSIAGWCHADLPWVGA
jgi:rhodanese-related sulfurtransferase